MSLEKLTKGNSDKFFDRMRRGQLFEVASTVFPDELRALTEANGLVVSYCEPGSDEYYRYGASVYKVLSEDISGLVNTALNDLASVPDRQILVKGACWSANSIRSASRIVFSDNVRRHACNRKVFNKMLKEGYIEKVRQFRKKSDIWHYFGITDAGRQYMSSYALS